VKSCYASWSYCYAKENLGSSIREKLLCILRTLFPSLATGPTKKPSTKNVVRELACKDQVNLESPNNKGFKINLGLVSQPQQLIEYKQR